jgi:FAD-dependent urate hydroxylase
MPTNLPTTDVAIVGAGPYGLSAAAHLRRAGVDARCFGDPMSFWRGMPKGMFLRSNYGATNIGALHGDLSLDAFQQDSGRTITQPVPLADFVDYGLWVQRRAVPDVDERLVKRVQRDAEGFVVTLEDGARLAARRVVVAGGIERFARRPADFADLPPQLASHTGDHSDMAPFAGKRLAVVGGGQSALECAALALEAGAEVEVFVRRKRIVWLRGHGVKKRLGRLGPVVYAPTDVGPLWYSRLVYTPRLFTSVLPKRAQLQVARRCIRPAGSHWLIERLQGATLNLSSAVRSARAEGEQVRVALEDGSTRLVDHLLYGTGYRIDIARYPFLSPELLMGVRRIDGYPMLARGMESSVPGLHFLGAPAAWSFGPINRFVSGSWYAGRAVAAAVTGTRPQRRVPFVIAPAGDEVQQSRAAAAP